MRTYYEGLVIPELPEGLVLEMWAKRMGTITSKKNRNDICDLISGHKAPYNKVTLCKWAPARPDRSAHYHQIGHYDSVQDALNVAAVLCFLGEIEYGS